MCPGCVDLCVHCTDKKLLSNKVECDIIGVTEVVKECLNYKRKPNRSDPKSDYTKGTVWVLDMDTWEWAKEERG